VAGLLGIFAFDEVWNVSRFTYYGLVALQHRGQSTAGLSLLSRIGISTKAERIRVEDMDVEGLEGWASVGFTGVRDVYPVDNGSVSIAIDGRTAADPLTVGEMVFSDPRAAVEVLGDYSSFIALSRSGKIAAYRSRLGLQPLVIGGFGFDMGIVASEPVALDVMGGEFRREIEPGEMVFIDKYGVESLRVKAPLESYCAIEYIYQARLDSKVNGSSIYEIRIKIGERLAKERPIMGDTVIGVPETALPFAVGYARALGLDLDLGFVRTGTPQRTMILADQFMKLVGVQLKLNPIRSAVRGKRIILIDDSMVTGNTLKNTVFNLRNAGAKEVHVLIGSPKIVSGCPFGVEIPDESELIAANLPEDKISAMIGCDSIAWLSLEGLTEVIGHRKLCTGCMTRIYPKGGDSH